MRSMYESPKTPEEKSSGGGLCEIGKSFDGVDLHFNRKEMLLGNYGNETMKMTEASCVAGRQRKCDYPLRMSPNSLSQRASPSTLCLSVDESLPLSVLNTEETEMEWQTLSEYGTFQRKAGSSG